MGRKFLKIYGYDAQHADGKKYLMRVLQMLDAMTPDLLEFELLIAALQGRVKVTSQDGFPYIDGMTWSK